MFPLLYQAHHSLHSEDLPFWLELASQSDDPILELGCGTGRILLPLARAGHKICGIDNDPGMLALLRGDLKLEPHLSVQPIQADFTNFSLARRFGLILLPCNTFSTLSSKSRRLTLQCVSRHLLPGGRFAVSNPNPYFLKRLPAHAEAEIEDIFPHPLDGEPVQVSSAWQRTRWYFILNWYYDHLFPDGSVERSVVEVKHCLVQPEDYLDEMRVAGLSPRAVYGDYDRSPLKRTSPQMIILASLEEPLLK